jgi:hypothetical protein
MALAAWTALGAAPASATDCAHANEQQLVDLPAHCRNFVIDPGQGRLLTRADLLARRHLFTTGPFGTYSDNFLWYAPERQITVTDPNAEWTVCSDVEGPGGACDPSRIRPSTLGPILEGFVGSGPVTLNVFEYGGAFIAKACGNSLITTAPRPTPTITGTKFHDLDRDGARDANEAGLDGWEIVLTRISSRFNDQSPGEVARFTTGSAGGYRFELVGQGPGVYQVSEISQDGWTQTTPVRTVTVEEGVGDREYGGNDVGNVENRTDVAKLDMRVVDPPQEFMVEVPTALTVRSVITNRGPAGPIDVRETLTSTGPSDCTITPAEQTLILTLGKGETRTVDSTVTVRCSQPSFHPFRFVNALTVATPGVTDTDPSNNGATAGHTPAVIALADLSVSEPALSCPVRADKGAPFRCTLSGTVSNQGPFGPVAVVPTYELQGPADCAITPAGSPSTVAPLAASASAPLSQTWTVTCSQRSFHEFTGSVAVRPLDIHVRDLDPADDRRATTRIVPVFEPGDLAVTAASILCDEVWTGDTFTCTLDARVANLGPADLAQATVVATLSGSTACQTATSREQSAGVTLPAGGSQTVRYVWRVACPVDLRVHDFTATITIAAAEPHVEDLNAGNDRYVVHWQPTDLKPNSDPNTINLKRDGVTSVAILATPGFDPLVQVNVSSLRYGPTGTEAPVVRCATEREDLNGDGLGDLSCKFNVADAGFRPGDTLAILTGTLVDGTPFMSADRVRVING